MSAGLTSSEKFVAKLCERAFLKLWSHPNPIGKKGKELCDSLVVCGPHVIIISVKEIEYKDTGDRTGYDRWVKRALEGSADQIWGAERWLKGVNEVVREDGRRISLPPHDKRQYHRIAVALSSKGSVPIKWGEIKPGFVHVCDENSLGVLFSVLDTITDFTDFLTATEELAAVNTQIVFDGGGVEDLLALYLTEGRSFESFMNEEKKLLIISNGLWLDFSKSQAFQDPRWIRVQFSEKIRKLHSHEGEKVRASIMHGQGDTVFVLLIASSEDREARVKELYLRSLVARAKVKGCQTVVGIATDKSGSSKVGYSHDIGYVHLPEWDAELDVMISKMQTELGYFPSL